MSLMVCNDSKILQPNLNNQLSCCVSVCPSVSVIAMRLSHCLSANPSVDKWLHKLEAVEQRKQHHAFCQVEEHDSEGHQIFLCGQGHCLTKHGTKLCSIAPLLRIRSPILVRIVGQCVYFTTCKTYIHRSGWV